MSVRAGERHVADTPQTRQLFALDKCLEMTVHTIKICANEKVFDPKYKSTTDKIVNIAHDVYINAFYANYIKVVDKDTRNERLRDQFESIRLCGVLLGEINIAQRLFHLKYRKFDYWCRLVYETRKLLSSWHASDYKRYNKYK